MYRKIVLLAGASVFALNVEAADFVASIKRDYQRELGQAEAASAAAAAAGADAAADGNPAAARAHRRAASAARQRAQAIASRPGADGAAYVHRAAGHSAAANAHIAGAAAPYIKNFRGAVSVVVTPENPNVVVHPFAGIGARDYRMAMQDVLTDNVWQLLHEKNTYWHRNGDAYIGGRGLAFAPTPAAQGGLDEIAATGEDNAHRYIENINDEINATHRFDLHKELAKPAAISKR